MRVFAVVLGVFYALAYGVPTVLYLSGQYGSIGVVKAGSIVPLPANRDVNTIGMVTRGSPAARAGIVPGDTVVLLRNERAPVFEQLFDRTIAGRPQQYAILHDGRRSVVTLLPRPVRPSGREIALTVAQLARGLAIVLIGALLVLLRPSIMTAAFYILCLQFAELAHPAGNLELVAALPAFWKPLFFALTCCISGAGPAVAAIFCMRFPSGEALPSWRPVEKAMVVVAAFTVVDYAAAIVAGATYTQLGSRLYAVFSVSAWLSYAVATAAFMVRYTNAAGEDRDRLRWVAIGIGSFLVSYALFWISQNVASAPGELSIWAQFINVLPLTVLYAIVRHRVIDVRLAGGRAIAYAVVSAVPIVAFSLVDWALGNQIQRSKFTLPIEVCVAVGFGFWANSSQRRTDNLIRSIFFHAQQVAEERLRRVARRIGHASERIAVDETLVREPFEALKLSSSALFRRVDGPYPRVAQCGWPEDTLPVLDANDPLVLEVVEARGPLELQTIGWEKAATMGSARPSLAFPIMVRHDLLGIVLFGAKRDGERFDSVEQSATEALVHAAATAYDHLEAVELRNENETLRTLLKERSSAPGTSFR